MTRGLSNAPDAPAPEPMPDAGLHPSGEVLAGYAAGAVDGVAAWSVESHLEACASCRSAVSVHVDGERLARNRAVLLAMAALPDRGRLWRLACRCGIPDHLLRLLTATSSLRRSWLLAVVGVLGVVTGQSVLVRHLWPGGGGHPGVGWGSGTGRAAQVAQVAQVGHVGQMTQVAQSVQLAQLAPFLLVGPLLVLAGVAAAFMPALDPSHRLAVAAPFPGLTLLLVRSVSALVAALVPVVCAAFLVPGPGWLPTAVLLPSLAVCALALAAATVVSPLAAAVTAGALWVVPVVWLAAVRSSLEVAQGHGQVLCAVVLVAAVSVAFVRRDRLEMGWAQ